MTWPGWGSAEMATKTSIAAAFRAAFPVSLPVLAGYLFLGGAYGVLMSRIGYGPLWTAALSLMVLGGTIQFIATSLLAAPFQPLHAFIISAMVNARHLFYGFSMLEHYAGSGWKKPFLIFWLTDETFALVCSGETPEGVDKNWFRFFVSGLDYLYWVIGGVVGNLAGSNFNFDAKGIDFVMTSLFTVIIMGQWRGARTRWPAMIGLLGAGACLPVFGPEHFLIPAMGVIIVVLMVCRGRLEGEVVGEGGEGEGGCG